MVKKGDVLFLMDKKPFQTQVNAVQAALEKQQAALGERPPELGPCAKPLSELNALSQKDLDDATASFKQAAQL